jgi:hypothetical protein
MQRLLACTFKNPNFSRFAKGKRKKKNGGWNLTTLRGQQELTIVASKV